MSYPSYLTNIDGSIISIEAVTPSDTADNKYDGLLVIGDGDVYVQAIKDSAIVSLGTFTVSTSSPVAIPISTAKVGASTTATVLGYKKG